MSKLLYSHRRAYNKRLLTDKELNERNQLWMVIEQVELSFALYLSQKLDYKLATGHIGSRRERSVVISSAFVATLLSYRKLADFFNEVAGKKHRPDDIKASQFGFRCAPPLTRAQMDELSKHIAHFTTVGLQLRKRGHAFGVLGAAIYTRCLEFFDFLETHYLDRELLADRQMIARMKWNRRFILAASLLPRTP